MMGSNGAPGGGMGMLAANGEKIKGDKYAYGNDALAAAASSSANPVSASGYTYSPSSTFQMAGNEQIQGKLIVSQFDN